MNKREIFERCWDSGVQFDIIVSPCPGAVLPDHLKGDVVLNIGRRLATPISNLLVDEAGITCGLSFNHSQFQCELPWRSVRVIATPEWMVQWPMADVSPKPMLSVVK